MTLTQYRRLCVFALRMVPISIGGKRWQNEVREHVRDVLYRMSVPNYDFHYPHIINWDNCERSEKRDIYGHTHPLASYPCDFMSTFLWDAGLEDEHGEYTGKVGRAVNCCIRAAMDVAVAPSAGVVGYTIGDLRRMWAPRPLPSWVTKDFEPEITASVPDSTPIWL